MRKAVHVAVSVAALVGCTLIVRAADSAGDAELQYQLGNLLSDETRYREALDAFDKATQTDDPSLKIRARAGKVRTALRIAEYSLAQTEAEVLKAEAPRDAEAIALYGDALWSAGLFDESEAVFDQALALNPESSRARFGRARALTSVNKLDAALTEAQAAREGRTVAVAKFPWAASGRALTYDRTDGLTKLLLEPETHRILGVGIVGHGAGELIGEGAIAVEILPLVRYVLLPLELL
mgnify:CR=1 FL=1